MSQRCGFKYYFPNPEGANNSLGGYDLKHSEKPLRIILQGYGPNPLWEGSKVPFKIMQREEERNRQGKSDQMSPTSHLVWPLAQQAVEFSEVRTFQFNETFSP